MFNYTEQFFALSFNNSMKFTIQSDYFNFEESKFSEKIIDSKLEEFFIASNDTGGWATLDIIEPKYSFICSVSMEIIIRKQYTMLVKLSGDYEDILYWWNPNCEIYTGYLEVPAIQPYPVDKRRIVDNIKYAQLLFYEFYKYGTLSDNVMANFRHIDNPKPKYYLKK